jgi:hypothetical protein
MKKAFAVAVLVFASSFALGVAFLAPSSKPASASVPVPASEPAPTVITVGTVLIEADPVQEAPKPLPVAARPPPAPKAKKWSCGERIVLQAGHKARAANPTSARTCEWR